MINSDEELASLCVKNNGDVLDSRAVGYVGGDYVQRIDGDNLHTSILDVLEHAKIIEDDNQVLRGRYEKIKQMPGWRATIVIKEIL